MNIIALMVQLFIFTMMEVVVSMIDILKCQEIFLT